MSSISVRGRKLYAWMKAVNDEWQRVATGQPDTPDGWRTVEEWIVKTERKIDSERTALTILGAPMMPMTVRRYAELWRDERARLGKDAKHEYARLKHHVLPVIGDMLLADVRTQHVVALFTHVRTHPSPKTRKPLSPRTIHNIHGVLTAVFRDAVLAGLIEHAPATLDERQLGRKIDKDPEWREGAMFTRDEVQTLISSSKIPWDRRVLYAIELLAGTRPSEAAALRWRSYDATKQPLGELFVALRTAPSSTKQKGRRPMRSSTCRCIQRSLRSLAGGSYRDGREMMGRPPEPDDLIVPLPPADAAARTRKRGEPFRPDYYSRRRSVEDDLPALGWRHRRHYDTRASFITLALEDGADREILETRVTHTKRSRSAFDMYNRGLQWAATCHEIAKLKITRVRDPDDNVIAMPLAANANGETPRDHTLDEATSSKFRPIQKNSNILGCL